VTLRVLHCIYDSPSNPWVAGGGAVRLHELYRRLEDRVSVTIATGSYPGARDETVDGVPYRRLGSGTGYARSRLSYSRAATRLLREAEYDVAVFDFSVYTPLRWPADRPVGLTVHHLTGPTARERFGAVVGGAIARVERRRLRRARFISATSRVTEDALRAIVHPGTAIVPVAAGVPDPLFELQRREADYILYFGRLDWFQKGIDTLLEATALLVRDHPRLELRVAGRGKDLDRSRAFATNLGIERNVRFLGAVTDAEREALFRGARLILMPSRFEGFGMVAAEAMAAGVPLIAAAAGSLPEVVSPPAGGVMVPVGDAVGLAAAADRLLRDASAREALSRSARASAERFRWSAVARDHLAFLERIREGSPVPHR
jgi:glycosyltransferase involved in cell wall biosynthesis